MDLYSINLQIDCFEKGAMNLGRVKEGRVNQGRSNLKVESIEINERRSSSEFQGRVVSRNLASEIAVF